MKEILDRIMKTRFAMPLMHELEAAEKLLADRIAMRKRLDDAEAAMAKQTPALIKQVTETDDQIYKKLIPEMKKRANELIAVRDKAKEQLVKLAREVELARDKLKRTAPDAINEFLFQMSVEEDESRSRFTGYADDYRDELEKRYALVGAAREQIQELRLEPDLTGPNLLARMQAIKATVPPLSSLKPTNQVMPAVARGPKYVTAFGNEVY